MRAPTLSRAPVSGVPWAGLRGWTAWMDSWAASSRFPARAWWQRSSPATTGCGSATSSPRVGSALCLALSTPSRGPRAAAAGGGSAGELESGFTRGVCSISAGTGFAGHRRRGRCGVRHRDAGAAADRTLHHDRQRPALVAVDDLLAKHFAILGTTGSGKSCAAALILAGDPGRPPARPRHAARPPRRICRRLRRHGRGGHRRHPPVALLDAQSGGGGGGAGARRHPPGPGKPSGDPQGCHHPGAAQVRRRRRRHRLGSPSTPPLPTASAT